jgi:hypothetical protein
MIFTAVLIIIPGLRFNVGTDYWSYISIYNSISLNRGIGKEFEPGFVFLNKLLKIFNFPPQSILFSMNMLGIFFLLQTEERRHTYVVIIVFFLTMFLHSLNISRQILALIIIYYSYSLLKKRKRLAALLILFVALFIHISSVLFFALFVFSIFVNIRKTTYIALFIAIFIFFDFGIVHIIDFTRFVLNGTPYIHYMDYINFSGGSLFQFVPLIKRIIMFVLLLFIQKIKNNFSRNALSSGFIMMLVSDMLMRYSVAFYRLPVLFLWYFIPCLVELKKQNTIYSNAMFAVTTASLFSTFLATLFSGAYDSIPYNIVDII